MKKYLIVIVFFAFYSAPVFSFETFEEKLKVGADFCKAKLFDASIEVFKEMLISSKDGSSEKEIIQKALAEAYFQNENYDKVIEVIDNQCDKESKLLAAMAFNQLKKYKQAVSCLLPFKSTEDDMLIYELGFSKFYLNELDEAELLFTLLTHSDVKKFIYLSKIYLIRIDLCRLNIDKALRSLSELQSILPKDHTMQDEVKFLEGQIFFKKHEYKMAIHAFESIMPSQDTFVHAWQQQVLNYLGWSYARTAEPRHPKKIFETQDQPNPHYAKNLYFKGLDELKKGRELYVLHENEKALLGLNRASQLFETAAELLKKSDKKLALFSLRAEAEALSEQNTKASLLKSILVLDEISSENEILNLLMDPDEIPFLKAIVLFKLKNIDEENQEEYALKLETLLNQSLSLYKYGKFADSNLNLLGCFYYKEKKYDLSEKAYLLLSSDYPKSPFVGDALFYAALSKELQNKDRAEVKALKNLVYTKYPNSKHADESYFFYYTYQDYIEGDRAAIKHLQCFAEHFPKSPLLLNSYYLLGMDHKRDRKTPEGKWIRKKNLTMAIDYFQSVESHFDILYKAGLLNEELSFYVTIRYLSLTEKAITNLKIAEDSQKVKAQIYLEYAKNLNLEIIEDFKNPENSLAKWLMDQEPIPKFLEESSYFLGLTYVKSNNLTAAKKTFYEMIETYRTYAITKGFFLSRAWYELGIMSMRDEDFTLALSCLLKAEDASKGKILNSEQKLDLWIQQSLCYQGLKQFDQAILVLSKVVNDDAISMQRLKAMYLRAEMYENQGRFELSRKQLEATSKKGGEWALKAKSKLENLNY